MNEIGLYCFQSSSSNLPQAFEVASNSPTRAFIDEILKDFNAKLSDFGLAKASTQVMGTHGYATPEYVATGTSTALSNTKKGAYAAATVALQCLSTEPKLRPRMAEVLATLEQLQAPKNIAKHTQPEHRTVSKSIGKSAARHHRSPMNPTPLASPLPPYWQSLRVR
ncbi:putative serine/threonine-protein kinase PBL2 [Camellia lanceoleosa]|uniref:Serine/threonine-protein kinase PBL2 n=1 Tax=Camellia lanceoleosa TaxID=1840588 RepID=A0ACC0GVY7_9ERIC|nr:putative serine/threonine-protein kinase PBL2 [Camellia lanceoleosa]